MSSCKFDFKLSSMFDVTSSISIRHRHLVKIAASSSSYYRKLMSAKGRKTMLVGFYSASELSLPDRRAEWPSSDESAVNIVKQVFQKVKKLKTTKIKKSANCIKKFTVLQ